MKIILNKKEGDSKRKNGSEGKSTKLLLELALFAFSLCAVTMLLFFVAKEEEHKESMPPIAEEYVSAFNDSYLYDILEIEYCENEKISEDVSEFGTFSHGKE